MTKKKKTLQCMLFQRKLMFDFTITCSAPKMTFLFRLMSPRLPFPVSEGKQSNKMKGNSEIECLLFMIQSIPNEGGGESIFAAECLVPLRKSYYRSEMGGNFMPL